ncbi:TnsA endonuclease N-terminal domain-containing protein [Paludibacter sp.]|uniref:TnsA endonuclease N-terminal domain-containing protein n=1 Tax=Paludibacter sp. TaxID=1898105 RepID=UPI001353B789|nr:TnsA endonuclease N-terminal domain-containing protein [Paludibacter sp.]MTK52141.1 heteromeric transposase endonuclease subunit TnsA [Paludibacter sp.]
MREINTPIRKIGKGSSSLHGLVYSKKNQTHRAFESTLERDFIETLEFDFNVDYYCEQPMEIQYWINDELHTYIPDVFVSFRTDLPQCKSMKSMICEVKYRSTLKERWSEFKPKFKAAKQYAENNGWIFRILTEHEIRTPYLDNVKFLLNYRDSEFVNANGCAVVLDVLTQLQNTCPEELILCSARDKKMQAESLYSLWHLVAIGMIGCDLTSPLNMRSELWVV